MEVVLAVLGATGVVVAMAANITNIARYVGERRRAAESGGGRGRRRGTATSTATVAPAPSAPAAVPPRLPSGTIRTPDQRVRVFVSSTLEELADERAAARRAIESLRLTPVMFELGARPHAPRDVYRAYLAQSDVFVAIYGKRYGWVAPGEEVSGLEDEYVLSRGLPRLVYVRREEGARDERLDALLGRVKADDAVSYKVFREPEELIELLGNDLAVLLSDRFARPAVDPVDPLPVVVPAPLPTPPTSFVGRTGLLDELADLLLRPDVRLLTLFGPGGAGKSRIAIELAERCRQAFAGDVSYVSLAAVRDPALVPSSLAIGLGAREAAGISTVRAMQGALARRSGLLVIDNFEHLVEAAPLIVELLQAAPALTVLVTSRALLRLSVEVAFPIPPLGLPDEADDAEPAQLLKSEAVRLFVDRARAADPHFALDVDNAAAVVEVCRRVDALPLAIELAAARVRSLPPRVLLTRMRRRLPLLTGGPRDAPERQRTLRDAIGWSVALLGPRDRATFARLSLFDGGGSVRLVEGVLGNDETLEAVTTLVDHSLIERVAGDDEERVAMLETVREYAAELFEADPERAELRDRHARAYLELAETGASALKGSDQARWGRWLVRDLANLRAAMNAFLESGAGEEALRLATALRPLFMARCHYEEGRRQLLAALAVGREVRGSVRAAALLALGALAWRAGDLASALPPLLESLAGYRQARDEAGEAATLRALGIHAHYAGDYDLARTRLQEALAAFRAIGDDDGTASTLLSLGNIAFDRGEPDARTLYEESLAIAERNGDTLGVAYARDNLSVLAWCHGELGEAVRHTESASVLYEELEHTFGLANVLHRRGMLALARDDDVTAERHLTASLRLRSEIGEGRGCAFVRYDLGRAALRANRPHDARMHFRLGLAQAERHGGPLVTVLYLEGVAALRAGEGRAEAALELLAAADAWRRAHGVPICRVNRAGFEALLAGIRTTLDEAARAAAEARGAGWTLPEAVDRARLALSAA